MYTCSPVNRYTYAYTREANNVLTEHNTMLQYIQIYTYTQTYYIKIKGQGNQAGKHISQIIGWLIIFVAIWVSMDHSLIQYIEWKSCISVNNNI